MEKTTHNSRVKSTNKFNRNCLCYCGQLAHSSMMDDKWNRIWCHSSHLVEIFCKIFLIIFQGANKLVPYLVPEPICEDSPREVCSFGVKSYSQGSKPLITKWCLKPGTGEGNIFFFLTWSPLVRRHLSVQFK